MRALPVPGTAATATARSNPILCPPPTILACTDSLDSIGQNISSPAYAGRQLALLQREAATVRRVVFRMLCPPDNPGCDNFEASQFSSSVDADQCSAGTVSVVQGGEGQADIDDGVNSRFGDDPDPSSSGNVVYYLRDPKIIAEEAEFFSFGTNDLTQTTFGLSRDDCGKIIKAYQEEKIWAADPFQVLDRKRVGRLLRLGYEEGRSSRPDLKVGICGEHGGDPSSVEYCAEVGLDYVSCSAFRVPIARLAAAQAAIKSKGTSYSTA